MSDSNKLPLKFSITLAGEKLAREIVIDGSSVDWGYDCGVDIHFENPQDASNALNALRSLRAERLKRLLNLSEDELKKIDADWIG